MNSITLAMLLAVTGSVVTVARAQDPVPPTPPVPAVPVPAPAPAPAPRTMMAPRAGVDMDAVREAQRAAREASRDMVDADRDASREMARASAEMKRDLGRDKDGFRALAPMAPLASMAPLPPMAPMPPMPAIAVGPGYSYNYDYNYNLDYNKNFNYNFSTSVGGGYGFAVRMPPAPWAQGDPADSVYRVARDAFNRGEYGRAARLFEDIRSKYPKSAYQSDSQYYEALARYKIGTTDELHAAAKLLEPLASKVINSSNSKSSTSSADGNFYQVNRRGGSDTEVAALYARINGVLAQRGDKDAAEKVAKFAAQGGGSVCDNDDIQVKVEAMNALSQMDPNAAVPLLKGVLDRKDDCSAELRRRAIFMLARRGDAESAQLLIATAKSDPSASVRSEAINALPRLPGDAGLSALEDILRTEQDERIQRAVIRSLSSSDNQKARSSMRALIDRKDAPLSLRIEAISAFNSDRATTEDAAYLRDLYSKADNDAIKEAIIGAVGRMGGADNDKWVLAIAQNTNEPSQIRSVAISRLIRSNVSIADLDKLYDAADSYNVRSQIVSVLASRKEPEATDKLIDIIRNGTVVQLRMQAINALQRKNDPRSVELLNNILQGKKP